MRSDDVWARAGVGLSLLGAAVSSLGTDWEVVRGIAAGVCGLGALAFFVLALWAHRRQRPDFNRWDGADTFRLYEAACLWVNLEPDLPLPWRARAQYKLFENALNEGGMPAAASPTVRDAIDRAFAKVNKEGWVDPNTLIDRGILAEWAAHHGQEPPFLYPKKRV